MKHISIPSIASVETALRIFYENLELGNKEIAALFNKKSATTINRLKKLAKDKQDSLGVPSHGMFKVNTYTAFEAWGLDVADLEKRQKKIISLTLNKSDGIIQLQGQAAH